MNSALSKTSANRNCFGTAHQRRLFLFIDQKFIYTASSTSSSSSVFKVGLVPVEVQSEGSNISVIVKFCVHSRCKGEFASKVEVRVLTCIVRYMVGICLKVCCRIKKLRTSPCLVRKMPSAVP